MGRGNISSRQHRGIPCFTSPQATPVPSTMQPLTPKNSRIPGKSLPPMSPPRGNNRLQVLSQEQVQRLHEVMCQTIPVHSRNPEHPTVHVCLKDFVKAVKNGLQEAGVQINDIRLNGGTASYIIGNDSTATYNDIDFLFGVNFSGSEHCGNITKVKSVTLDALLSFLRRQDVQQWGSTDLQDSYISKLFRVVSDTPAADRWSLIALGNTEAAPPGMKTIELKFVDRMRRAYEFTVDSFQIILDSLLTFYEVATVAMSAHFYPTVVADSVAGDFQDALFHLKNRLISTKNPEEIRGGGLLKYCRLLLEGYQAAAEIDILHMEKYMCSRFFIDFPDLSSQRSRIVSYLSCHFAHENDKKVVYLDILQNVIWTSTVCLMNHERYQTLHLIESLMADLRAWGCCLPPMGMVSPVGPAPPITPNVIHQEDIGGDEWVLDQVVYGTQCFLDVPLFGNGTTPPLYTSSGELSPASSWGLMDSVSLGSSMCPSPANSGIMLYPCQSPYLLPSPQWTYCAVTPTGMDCMTSPNPYGQYGDYPMYPASCALPQDTGTGTGSTTPQPQQQPVQ